MLQEEDHDRGRRGVELVKSTSGWTVRSMSGLENFQVVAGGHCDPHWPST
jgi:hypothetical protein